MFFIVYLFFHIFIIIFVGTNDVSLEIIKLKGKELEDIQNICTYDKYFFLL